MGIISCEWCGTSFPSSGRRRFCSDAHRQASYRARHTPQVIKSIPTGLDAVVYQCPSCDQRYLGIRRCPDCNLFCSRIGLGGPCPHCYEPVAHSDLDNSLSTVRSEDPVYFECHVELTNVIYTCHFTHCTGRKH